MIGCGLVQNFFSHFLARMVIKLRCNFINKLFSYLPFDIQVLY